MVTHLGVDQSSWPPSPQMAIGNGENSSFLAVSRMVFHVSRRKHCTVSGQDPAPPASIKKRRLLVFTAESSETGFRTDFVHPYQSCDSHLADPKPCTSGLASPKAKEQAWQRVFHQPKSVPLPTHLYLPTSAYPPLPTHLPQSTSTCPPFQQGTTSIGVLLIGWFGCLDWCYAPCTRENPLFYQKVVTHKVVCHWLLSVFQLWVTLRHVCQA